MIYRGCAGDRIEGTDSTGRASFVEQREEKIRILDLIVAQFSEQRFTYPEPNLKATFVIRIDIDSIKGKQHGQE